MNTNQETQMEIVRLQAKMCKALSDPKRLRIIRELREGEKTVSDLVNILELKQSNTSQHLGVLRRIGVVISRKEGSTVYYRLSSQKIAEACDMVHEVIADQIRNHQSLYNQIKNL